MSWVAFAAGGEVCRFRAPMLHWSVDSLDRSQAAQRLVSAQTPVGPLSRLRDSFSWWPCSFHTSFLPMSNPSSAGRRKVVRCRPRFEHESVPTDTQLLPLIAASERVCVSKLQLGILYLENPTRLKYIILAANFVSPFASPKLVK